ncbi:MAG: FAD-dependent oxidoreductase, partial [Candidatus Micrarchaeota archaeon]
MEKCDVLVVGAGASGSVAALKAAKEGLKTIVIEKKKKPGDAQTRIDITRDSGITEIVQELKLEIGDHSNMSRWFSPKDSFILNSKIGDYFVKRGQAEDSFEVSTIRKAEDFGAELITGVKIDKVKKEGNLVKELTLNSGEVISPSHIIVAAGQEPDVLRKHKIHLEEKNPI